MAEPVITASIYKVAVLIMSLINYVTHQYTNATQNTPHKTTQTPHNAPHKTNPGEGLQSLTALFLVVILQCWLWQRSTSWLLKSRLIKIYIIMIFHSVVNICNSLPWHREQGLLIFLKSYISILMVRKLDTDSLVDYACNWVWAFCLHVWYFFFLVWVPSDYSNAGHLIWIGFILIPFWIQLNNNNKRHGSGSGVWSKQSCIKAGRLGARSSLSAVTKWQL